jgi:hypothetical protein
MIQNVPVAVWNVLMKYASPVVYPAVAVAKRKTNRVLELEMPTVVVIS